MSSPRHSYQEDITETSPLATSHPAPWFEERDLGSERLPTYREAIKNTSQRSTVNSDVIAARMEQLESGYATTSERSRQTRMNAQQLHKLSPCLLMPVLILGVSATVSGIIFVNQYARPSPPRTSPWTIELSEHVFTYGTSTWAIIAYPFLFSYLLIILPQIFGLPRQYTYSTEGRSKWRSLSKDSRSKAGRFCCTLYCGLTIVYFAIIAVTIWAVHFAASKELQRSISVPEGSWAGNYILVEKTSDGSSSTLYSSSGIQLGSISFEDVVGGFTMDIQAVSEVIEKIEYDYPSTALPAQLFNATCRTSSVNTTNGNLTSHCLTGGMYQLPDTDVVQGDSTANAEYNNQLQVTITVLNDSFSTNTSSQSPIIDNPAGIWTDPSDYQGIGLQYPPLGSWYIDEMTVLQVTWNLGGTQVCNGFRINLSKEYESLALPIVGIIYQWWRQWGNGVGCSWGDTLE